MTTNLATPLKVTDYRYPDNSFNGVAYVTNAIGEYVCSGFKNEAAVAELKEVVRRANCHDELLACLIELASGHSMAGEAKARAAIAAATGESANVPA